MAETYRLQWDRDVHGEGNRSERIRYRRGRGAWCDVSSVDDLPEDIRRAVDQARGVADSLEDEPPNLRDADGVRRRFKVRRRARRPTRAREIDRTLYLDHPWFDGLLLVMIAIAAPSMAYQSWKGLDEGGGVTLAAGMMLALSALLAYYGLCVLVNATEYRVDDEWLTVKHGPLPWPGARKIPVDHIAQLSTLAHRSRHSLTYSLWASVLGRPPVRLAEGINTFAEARSVERAIERHLGIEDRDV